MDSKKLIQDYLKQARVMHLATTIDNKPWVCNVHFYVDEQTNLYWISDTNTRHSKEIAQNANVAAVLKVHEDTPEERYVIGLTIEGTAEILSIEETKRIGERYIEKTGKAATLLEGILAGTGQSKMYRLMPTNFVLFDSKNFPDQPRQECCIGEIYNGNDA